MSMLSISRDKKDVRRIQVRRGCAPIEVERGRLRIKKFNKTMNGDPSYQGTTSQLGVK